MLRQYGEAILLWRMDVEAYRLAVAAGGRPLKEAELQAFSRLAPEFHDLVTEMVQVGQAGYQEALTALLWADMK